ncbi:MAG: hypothetical protein KJ769_08405 [Candidatus Margulisbacteria bacterium]|nr:hypothetical protein [Candidatus Margulisiibacteriota bacterium]
MTPIEWLQEINMGIEQRNKFGLAKDWDNILNLYNGKQAKNILSYNILYGMGKVLLAKLYYANPYITINLNNNIYYDENVKKFADVLETIDNWIFTDVMDTKAQLKLIIQDTFLYGTGIIKIGYDSEYGFDKNKSIGELQDGTLSQFDKKGNRIEYNENIQEGMPWILRVNPRDVVFNWNATSIKDCQWVAHRFLRHIDDIKADVKYTNTRGLSPNVKLENKSKQYVELWEIRDTKTKKMYIIAKGYDKYLYEGIDDLQINGLPYAVLNFNNVGDSIWCVGDAHILMPQQLEINETRTQTMFYRRLALLKLIAEKNAFDKDDIIKLLSDEPVAFLESNGNPNTVLREFKVDIPSDLTQWVELVRQDAKEIMGFSRIQLGELETSGRKTAYEIAQTAASTEIRVGERADIVSDVFKDIVIKVNKIIGKFWSSQRVLKIMGNSDIWTEYNGEDFNFDYSINLNITEKHPMNIASRKGEAMELYKMLMPDPELTPLARKTIRDYVLSQFDNISDLMGQTQGDIQQEGNISPEGEIVNANIPNNLPSM